MVLVVILAVEGADPDMKAAVAAPTGLGLTSAKETVPVFWGGTLKEAVPVGRTLAAYFGLGGRVLPDPNTGGCLGPVAVVMAADGVADGAGSVRVTTVSVSEALAFLSAGDPYEEGGDDGAAGVEFTAGEDNAEGRPVLGLVRSVEVRATFPILCFFLCVHVAADSSNVVEEGRSRSRRLRFLEEDAASPKDGTERPGRAGVAQAGAAADVEEGKAVALSVDMMGAARRRLVLTMD